MKIYTVENFVLSLSIYCNHHTEIRPPWSIKACYLGILTDFLLKQGVACIMLTIKRLIKSIDYKQYKVYYYIVLGWGKMERLENSRWEGERKKLRNLCKINVDRIERKSRGR